MKMIFGILVFVMMAGCVGAAGPMGRKGDTGNPGSVGSTGSPGENGLNGVDGSPGTNGKTVSGLTVKVDTLCQGEVNQAGVFAYGLEYTSIVYNNGDVLVTCSVKNGVTQSSETSFYDAKQVGAGTEDCTVSSSDGADSFGFWVFELGSTGYIATYHDQGSSNDGFVFEFTGTSSTDNGCTEHTF